MILRRKKKRRYKEIYLEEKWMDGKQSIQQIDSQVRTR